MKGDGSLSTKDLILIIVLLRRSRLRTAQRSRALLTAASNLFPVQLKVSGSFTLIFNLIVS